MSKQLSRYLLMLSVIFAPVMALSDTVVPVRTIRAQAILTAADVEMRDIAGPGAFTMVSQLVGLETREVLYVGRPIHPNQVGPPALVERNQAVQMIYAAGQVQIATEGRALGRAAMGEIVRVMNLASRNTVTAIVEGPSLVIVSSSQAFSRGVSQ